MKKLIIVFIIIVIAIIFMQPRSQIINYTKPIYAYDTSDPKIAVGASTYVFVGKINEIMDTKYIDNNPYTIYDVTNLKNIKGNLEKNIILNQYGGLNKDKTYTFVEGGGYLKEGSLYILLTGINENKELEVSDPNRMVKLPNNNIDSKESKKVINKYILAYESEEIPISSNGNDLSN